MWKVGDRVTAGFHKGTVIEWNDEVRKLFPNVKSREGEFCCVRFDGAGPNIHGFGTYHAASQMLRKLRPNEDK